MPARILLLAGDVEAPYLAEKLRAFSGDLKVVQVKQASDLITLVADGLENTRLISVFSDVIVPADVIASLPGPCYNFHPGPPEYPGIYPSCFATYDKTLEFGVTLHEIEAEIDSGRIVEVRRFAVPDTQRFVDLEMMAYEQVIYMFNDYAEHLACNDAPLPVTDDQWSGPRRTKAEWKRMKEVTTDMSEDEVRRRIRAFG